MNYETLKSSPVSFTDSPHIGFPLIIGFENPRHRNYECKDMKWRKTNYPVIKIPSKKNYKLRYKFVVVCFHHHVVFNPYFWFVFVNFM